MPARSAVATETTELLATWDKIAPDWVDNVYKKSGSLSAFREFGILETADLSAQYEQMPVVVRKSENVKPFRHAQELQPKPADPATNVRTNRVNLVGHAYITYEQQRENSGAAKKADLLAKLWKQLEMDFRDMQSSYIAGTRGSNTDIIEGQRDCFFVGTGNVMDYNSHTFHEVTYSSTGTELAKRWFVNGPITVDDSTGYGSLVTGYTDGGTGWINLWKSIMRVVGKCRHQGGNPRLGLCDEQGYMNLLTFAGPGRTGTMARYTLDTAQGKGTDVNLGISDLMVGPVQVRADYYLSQPSGVTNTGCLHLIDPDHFKVQEDTEWRFKMLTAPPPNAGSRQLIIPVMLLYRWTLRVDKRNAHGMVFDMLKGTTEG